MKRALLTTGILLGLFIISQPVPAQQRFTEEEKEEAIERYLSFQEDLNLSKEQQPKVDEINKNYFEGLKKIRMSNTTRMEKFRTYKNLSSERDKELKKVLNENQYERYKEFQKEVKSNIRERRRNS